jgi:purine-binding chemotaxis protein CheW
MLDQATHSARGSAEAVPPASPYFFLPSPDFWQEDAPATPSIRYLAFDLAGQSFAMPLVYVREVERIPPVCPLPNVPGWLLGAANLRGEVISVVDLAAFIGLPSPTGSTRRLDSRGDARLLATRAGAMEAGLAVERVREIREVQDAAIQRPTVALPAQARQFVNGLIKGTGRATFILDVPRLMQAAEFRQFE